MPPEKESERSQPELKGASAASQAAEELLTPPSDAAPGSAAPAAAAQSKRKASVEATGLFQKKKKSTPVGQ